jgi:hypothetical protein
MERYGLGVTDQARNRALIEGLVGPEHVVLYRQNAVFRSGIDTLAQLLVPMVDGLAAYSTGRAEHMDQLRRLLTSPFVVQGLEVRDPTGLPPPSPA